MSCKLQNYLYIVSLALSQASRMIRRTEEQKGDREFTPSMFPSSLEGIVGSKYMKMLERNIINTKEEGRATLSNFYTPPEYLQRWLSRFKN